MKSIYSDSSADKRSIALAMFLAWLCVVSFLSWTHLVWRDEVKVLSIALKGDSVFAMLKELRWEGHPSVWYLLLRAAHTLIARPEVLLLVSVVVAAVAILILVLRAPFSLPLLALILFGRFSMYEYSVVARNNGISMLLLFLFAVFYERHRDRNLLLGVLLFLLANCNVLSALLVGGLLLFWFVDILGGEATNRPRSIRMFLYNAGLAVAGVVTCFITVFPPLSDAIVIYSGGITFKTLMKGIFLPSLQLDSWGLPGFDRLASHVPLLDKPLTIVKSLILFGSTLGLIRRRGAFLAALTTLIGFSLFFLVLNPGAYRHQALWLVFLVCMYWLAASGDAQKEPVSLVQSKPIVGLLSTVGTALFVLLLFLQLRYSAQKISGIATAPMATLENRNNKMKSILAGYPDLQQAVIIADPDFLLETLPYYVSNPTYLTFARTLPPRSRTAATMALPCTTAPSLELPRLCIDMHVPGFAEPPRGDFRDFNSSVGRQDWMDFLGDTLDCKRELAVPIPLYFKLRHYRHVALGSRRDGGGKSIIASKNASSSARICANGKRRLPMLRATLTGAVYVLAP